MDDMDHRGRDDRRAFHPPVTGGSVLLAFGLAVAALVWLGGCGGSRSGNGASDSSSEAASDAAAAQEATREAKRQRAEQQLQQRQEAACDRVGDEIYRCSVEDARETMTPEEFAELEPEKLAPMWKAKFMEECAAGKMSLRQIKVFETCVETPECAVFIPCLDGAQATEPAE